MDADAAMDANETYRQKYSTSRNKSMEPRSAGGQSTRNAPAAVATPLPPRNFSQIGKQWPSSADSAASIIQVALPPVMRAASQTGAAPLAISNSSVSSAGNGPATRATFVAPMLPLPDLRTSPPPNNRVNSTPNGMDPSTYAAMGIPIVAREIFDMFG